MQGSRHVDDSTLVHFQLICACLGCVVTTEKVNVNDGLERISRQVIEGRQEIARRSATTPTSRISFSKGQKYQCFACVFIHQKVNLAQLLDSLVRCRLHALNATNIPLQSQNVAPRTLSRDLLCLGDSDLGLAADDGSVRTKLDQCLDLAAANRARTARAEDNLSSCSIKIRARS